MNHKLSVIIPCYNCQGTLEEALASVYAQGLAVPFEVVMVDDGSTDGTRDLMCSLSRKYSNVRCAWHDTNRGGGAARNTAVEYSDGDLIFCLDSDNILGHDVLPRMVAFLDENGCDGVVLHERRYFRGTNPKWYRSQFQTVLERPITLQDSLLGENQMDNFLYTRESFQMSGGYPVEHGYDTQGYELRYLFTGFRPWVCPGTYYFHRQAQASAASYFERVYDSGAHSLNTYLILEDIMCLLSQGTRGAILDYDLWQHNQIGGDNLMSTLREKWWAGDLSVFTNDCQRFAIPHGWQAYFDAFKDSPEVLEQFCCAIHCYKQGDYQSALERYVKLIQNGLTSRLVYVNLLRVVMAMSGQYGSSHPDTEFQRLIDSLIPAKRTLFPRGKRGARLHDVCQRLTRGIHRVIDGTTYRLVAPAVEAVVGTRLFLKANRVDALVEELRRSARRLGSEPSRPGFETRAPWSDNQDRLAQWIAHHDPSGFLRSSVISKTMFIGNAKFVENELAYLKKHPGWRLRWREALREVNVGKPKPFWRYPASSGNLIHLCYHLAQFEDHTGTRVEDMGLILEFGGGYGGTCRLVHRLGFRGQYIIFDLPMLAALQRFYLASVGLGITDRETAQPGGSQGAISLVSDMKELRALVDRIPPPSGSLLVATWSLSEAPIAVRNDIFSIAKGFTAFLITYQHVFQGVNNPAYFREWRVARPDVSWSGWRIRQLPHDNYLVGVKL